jgi:hypothetical protein
MILINVFDLQMAGFASHQPLPPLPSFPIKLDQPHKQNQPAAQLPGLPLVNYLSVYFGE